MGCVCQRELEVYGKDAYELIQLMTCRNLSKALPNKCYYVPLVDKDGYIINDPLIIKINDQMANLYSRPRCYTFC